LVGGVLEEGVALTIARPHTFFFFIFTNIKKKTTRNSCLKICVGLNHCAKADAGGVFGGLLR
jgi:hypothetical protein